MGLIAPFVIIWMTILRTLISIAAIALLITTLHAEEQPQIASPTVFSPPPRMPLHSPPLLPHLQLRKSHQLQPSHIQQSLPQLKTHCRLFKKE